MRAIVVTDPVRKSLNIIDNKTDDRKVKPAKVKPFIPCPKHVVVDCGDKPGKRRTLLAPVTAIGLAGFPGLYV